MNTLVAVFAVLMPFWGVILSLLWAQRRWKEKRRSPLTEALQHLPGESLRRRLFKAEDALSYDLTMIIVLGPCLFSVWAFVEIDWSKVTLGLTEALMLLIAIVASVWLHVRLVRTFLERRAIRHGLLGEIAVAQALDALKADGCQVFHDIATERGNIDHVVVGPCAVFAVETKWRGKPQVKGKRSATVRFDGRQLQFPDHTETAPVEQALAVAGWLRKHLAGATGEPVRVVPVVMLPGWYVENNREGAASEVRVGNPKMTRFMLDASTPPIPEPQRRRIAHALVQRYPVLPEEAIALAPEV